MPFSTILPKVIYHHQRLGITQINAFALYNRYSDHSFMFIFNSTTRQLSLPTNSLILFLKAGVVKKGDVRASSTS